LLAIEWSTAPNMVANPLAPSFGESATNFAMRKHRLKAIDRLLNPVASADPPTTITVRSSTRHLLENMKRPGETYDDLIQELAGGCCPPRVIAELRQRIADIRAGRAKGIPAAEMRKRLAL
jgi:hypothetical protein